MDVPLYLHQTVGDYAVRIVSPLSQAAVFYGSGFMRINEVFSLGAINGLIGLLLWAVLGMPVWKLLGWW